jgi:pimeloyl-ACP methyl ester carboxylesterase
MLPHWTQNDITVDGVKIHYYRTGRGDEGKPALVLAHGFSDNGLCWLRVALDLQDECDVVLPDARAHGLSQRVQPGDKLDMAADLAGLTRALALEKPVVGGHSMGAGAAALMEARFPGLARALILEDPGWRAPEPPSPGEQAGKEPPRNPFEEWLMSLEGQSIEDVAAKGRADTPTWSEIEWPAWAESKLQLDKNFFQTEGTRRDWPEVARAIRCPALLLTADPAKGAIVTSETAQQAAALSGSIQVVNIPGAGHNIRRENYPAFMRAVREFLNSCE